MKNWSWNDKLGHRSRCPRCVIITNKGDVVRFEGNDIKGIVKVLGSSFIKNGKWSNTTYRCISPDGTHVVSWKQDWENGETFPQDSWEDAFEWLKNQIEIEDVIINFDSFKECVRTNWVKSAHKFDENAAAIEEMSML